MKLKEKTDLSAFIKQVQKCASNVWFRTEEGDNLNLKSTLSQYLLIALEGNRPMLDQGKIVCDQDEDYPLLRDFLE